MCRTALESGGVTNQHKLTLTDGTSDEVRIAADSLAALIGALLDGARHATRFAVEGRSTRSGPRPSWLDAACRLEIVGLEAGSTVLRIEAPVLEEIASERFPGHLNAAVAGLKGSATAVDLFAEVLSSALDGSVEKIEADRALMESCVRFGQVARQAGGDLRLEGLTFPQEKVVLKRVDVPRLELLRDQTPVPQAVRLAGQLDTISANKANVILLVEGQRIEAHLEHHRPEQLVALFGKDVVVSGMARFRPSGRLLTIDAEYLEQARSADALFAKVPVGRAQRQSLLSESQVPGSGIAAFFGQWPGHESDSELMASLETLG